MPGSNVKSLANTSLGMEQPNPDPKDSANNKKGIGATGSVSKGSLPDGTSLGMEQPNPKVKDSGVK